MSFEAPGASSATTRLDGLQIRMLRLASMTAGPRQSFSAVWREGRAAGAVAC
jgi:hypothetical protein